MNPTDGADSVNDSNLILSAGDVRIGLQDRKLPCDGLRRFPARLELLLFLIR